MEWCGLCNKDVEVEVKRVFRSASLKGGTFDLIRDIGLCVECGEETYSEDRDNRAMKDLVLLWLGRMRLDVESVRDLRAFYGISKNLFMKIIGCKSSEVYDGWETGKYIPNENALSVLRYLAGNEYQMCNFDDYMVRIPLTEEERKEYNECVERVRNNTTGMKWRWGVQPDEI